MNKDAINALTRIGAQQEGIFRHDFIMPDGRKRDTAVLSILDEEWPRIRKNLARQLRSAEPTLAS